MLNNGEKFGKLSTIEFAGYKYKTHLSYKCFCACGNITIATHQQLVSGTKRSCGCARKGINSSHGKSKSRMYKIWASIKNRCDNGLKNYGERGITYCDKWKTFEGFYEDMKYGYSDELSIDRINVNGNYNKHNCRWANINEQANNRRNNKLIEIDGEIKTLSQWLSSKGISRNTYFSRISNQGLSEIEAIIKPIKGRNGIIKHNGLSMSLQGWSEFLGIKYKTLYRRVCIKKYPLEIALTSDTFLGKNIFG